MYKKVSTDLNTTQRESQTLQFWNDNEIFKKSIAQSKDRPSFAFYDGPPTANGRPHVGHVLTRAIKDLIPRYKTMKGFNVLRKAGWDTHGLPVETGVEKSLGIQGKLAIENYGVEKFIEKCKSSVWEYEQLWREFSERSAYWVDMEDPYVTYDNNYIESVWWALRQIWDKDLIYKGHRVSPYCPSCGTTLSSHEVAQGYQDLTENSVYVQFKVKNTTNEYLLAWTTTPWTLPSNVGLVVNGAEDYARVAQDGNIYILAHALVSEVLPEGKVLEIVKGSTLEYLEYERLFDFIEVNKKAFYVTCDPYVTLDSGTGIVHNAPAFGEDDNRVARKYDLPFIQLVDDQGKFLDSVTLWKGIAVKKADPSIIEHLQANNQLFKIREVTHSYPHCWRCKSYLIYYARESWFISMTSVREKLTQNNNTVNWMPDNIKEGRFGNFLENVIDWNLSRERYWGTPLPVWICNDCGHQHLVGSIEELNSMSDRPLTDLDLHKPYVDNIHLNCPSCKTGKMSRTPEVIDCWFDSGSMPFAQFHYPFENKELFENNFPANFISEGIDQTRGWFYTLMAISTVVFDKAPYENVIVLGHVLDKHGKKMSKSLGNVVDPMEALGTYGADAIRWYFYAVSQPWLNSRFGDAALKEHQNKFLGTLWNTYAFYVLYANIDQFDPTAHTLDKDQLPLMDKWILSKLNSTISFVDNALDNYKLTEAARALDNLVDNLSNWYIRRTRERFWVSGMPQDKINAYMTLHTVLSQISLLAAPFIPFMAEELWQNLVYNFDNKKPISVHLASYPTADESYIDQALETQMDSVYQIAVLGRTARNVANLKNRQPLSKMYVSLLTPLEESYKAIIMGELNLKAVEFISDVSEYASYKFKPQLKTLGPKYGKILPKISKFLAEAKPSFKEALKSGVTIDIDGTSVELTEADVLIETMQSEGYATESNGQITIVIDTDLTPELIEEGLVREVISKIQTMRKEAGFEVTDKINLFFEQGASLSDLLLNNAQKIKSEVFAQSLTEGIPTEGYAKTWDINEHVLTLLVQKI